MAMDPSSSYRNVLSSVTSVLTEHFRAAIRQSGDDVAPLISVPERVEGKVDLLFRTVTPWEGEGDVLVEAENLPRDVVSKADITKMMNVLGDQLEDWCRLDGKAFSVVGRVLLAGEEGVKRDQGFVMMTLTIDAFIHDHEFGIEAEELESHLVVAGKYLVAPLYLAVFDESRSLRSRRWAGFLLIALLRGYKGNMEILKECPSDWFHNMGRILVDSNDRLLKGISGIIMAEVLSRFKQPWLKKLRLVWPSGTNIPEFAYTFPSPNDNENWEVAMFNYIHELEKVLEIEPTGFNVTSLRIGATLVPSSCALVSITDHVSVYIPRQGANPPIWLDIPAYNVEIVELFSLNTSAEVDEEQRLGELQITLVDHKEHGCFYHRSLYPCYEGPNIILLTCKDLELDQFADQIEKARDFSRLLPESVTISDLKFVAPGATSTHQNEEIISLQQRRDKMVEIAQSPAASEGMASGGGSSEAPQLLMPRKDLVVAEERVNVLTNTITENDIALKIERQVHFSDHVDFIDPLSLETNLTQSQATQSQAAEIPEQEIPDIEIVQVEQTQAPLRTPNNGKNIIQSSTGQAGPEKNCTSKNVGQPLSQHLKMLSKVNGEINKQQQIPIQKGNSKDTKEKLLGYESDMSELSEPPEDLDFQESLSSVPSHSQRTNSIIVPKFKKPEKLAPAVIPNVYKIRTPEKLMPKLAPASKAMEKKAATSNPRERLSTPMFTKRELQNPDTDKKVRNSISAAKNLLAHLQDDDEEAPRKNFPVQHVPDLVKHEKGPELTPKATKTPQRSYAKKAIPAAKRVSKITPLTEGKIANDGNKSTPGGDIYDIPLDDDSDPPPPQPKTTSKVTAVKGTKGKKAAVSRGVAVTKTRGRKKKQADTTAEVPDNLPSAAPVSAAKEKRPRGRPPKKKPDLNVQEAGQQVVAGPSRVDAVGNVALTEAGVPGILLSEAPASTAILKRPRGRLPKKKSDANAQDSGQQTVAGPIRVDAEDTKIPAINPAKGTASVTKTQKVVNVNQKDEEMAIATITTSVATGSKPTSTKKKPHPDSEFSNEETTKSMPPGIDPAEIRLPARAPRVAAKVAKLKLKVQEFSTDSDDLYAADLAPEMENPGDDIEQTITVGTEAMARAINSTALVPQKTPNASKEYESKNPKSQPVNLSDDRDMEITPILDANTKPSRITYEAPIAVASEALGTEKAVRRTRQALIISNVVDGHDPTSRGSLQEDVGNRAQLENTGGQRTSGNRSELVLPQIEPLSRANDLKYHIPQGNGPNQRSHKPNEPESKTPERKRIQHQDDSSKRKGKATSRAKEPPSKISPEALQDKLANKPQIIAWGKDGPLNQGRMVDKRGNPMSSSAATSPAVPRHMDNTPLPTLVKRKRAAEHDVHDSPEPTGKMTPRRVDHPKRVEKPPVSSSAAQEVIPSTPKFNATLERHPVIEISDGQESYDGRNASPEGNTMKYNVPPKSSAIERHREVLPHVQRVPLEEMNDMSPPPEKIPEEDVMHFGFDAEAESGVENWLREVRKSPLAQPEVINYRRKKARLVVTPSEEPEGASELAWEGVQFPAEFGEEPELGYEEEDVQEMRYVEEDQEPELGYEEEGNFGEMRYVEEDHAAEMRDEEEEEQNYQEEHNFERISQQTNDQVGEQRYTEEVEEEPEDRPQEVQYSQPPSEVSEFPHIELGSEPEPFTDSEPEKEQEPEQEPEPKPEPLPVPKKKQRARTDSSQYFQTAQQNTQQETKKSIAKKKHLVRAVPMENPFEGPASQQPSQLTRLLKSTETKSSRIEEVPQELSRDPRKKAKENTSLPVLPAQGFEKTVPQKESGASKAPEPASKNPAILRKPKNTESSASVEQTYTRKGGKSAEKLKGDGGNSAVAAESSSRKPLQAAKPPPPPPSMKSILKKCDSIAKQSDSTGNFHLFDSSPLLNRRDPYFSDFSSTTSSSSESTGEESNDAESTPMAWSRQCHGVFWQDEIPKYLWETMKVLEDTSKDVLQNLQLQEARAQNIIQNFYQASLEKVNGLKRAREEEYTKFSEETSVHVRKKVKATYAHSRAGLAKIAANCGLGLRQKGVGKIDALLEAYELRQERDMERINEMKRLLNAQ